jgi:hypothetical protein
VKFRWWKKADLGEIAEKFKEKYSVEKIDYPRSDTELALYKDAREEIKIKADTLSVRVSNFRAVLYQQEHAKFTSRDADLREEIGKIYPNDRSTPFPWMFSVEPEFEVE